MILPNGPHQSDVACFQLSRKDQKSHVLQSVAKLSVLVLLSKSAKKSAKICLSQQLKLHT